MPLDPPKGLIKIFSLLLSFGCYSALCWRTPEIWDPKHIQRLSIYL